MIACFLSNISAKYYKNPSMLSRVIAKNVRDVFFETQCIARFTLQRSERAAGFQCAAGLVARGFRVRYRSVKIVIEIKFDTTT